MNNPFDFFDKIYCINLPESVDRKNQVSKVFKDLGILDKVKFDAFTPRPPNGIKLSNVSISCAGVYGVSLSNLKVIFDATNSICKNMLILEDDIKIRNDINYFNKMLSLAIQELPSNWDILYLGGKPKREVIKYSNHLVKVRHMVGAYAYALNRRAFIPFINKFIGEIGKYPHDGTIGSFASGNNGFCVYPPLIKTEAGFSVLRNAHRDYDIETDKSWDKYGL